MRECIARISIFGKYDTPFKYLTFHLLMYIQIISFHINTGQSRFRFNKSITKSFFLTYIYIEFSGVVVVVDDVVILKVIGTAAVEPAEVAPYVPKGVDEQVSVDSVGGKVCLVVVVSGVVPVVVSDVVTVEVTEPSDVTDSLVPFIFFGVVIVVVDDVVIIKATVVVSLTVAKVEPGVPNSVDESVFVDSVAI